MSNEYKVAAIVVTYNRLDLLKKCIIALEHQSEMQIEHLIIINNNSTDGTAEYLSKLPYEGVIVKNLDKNLGGAGGFNKGLKVAIEETNDNYFWMMDDDTFVHTDTLMAFKRAGISINNSFSFLSANVKDPNGRVANVPETSEEWTSNLGSGLVQVSNASFVSIFIKRQAISSIGYPISDFFIWHDDTEYTMRLNRFLNGYLVADADVTHNAVVGDTKITAINDNEKRISRYFYLFRNEVYIMRQYFNSKRVIKAVLHGYLVAFECLLRGRDHRMKRFLAVLKGTTSGLFFKPSIEHTR